MCEHSPIPSIFVMSAPKWCWWPSVGSWRARRIKSRPISAIGYDGALGGRIDGWLEDVKGPVAAPLLNLLMQQHGESLPLVCVFVYCI